MSDDRSNVYVEDGISIYRASSLGRCQKALVAARLGMPESPVPSWLQTLFDHGNRGEDAIIDLLPEYGWRFDGGGQDLIELTVSPTAKVRGHIDGKATPWITETGAKQAGDQMLMEAKTMSPNVFRDNWKRNGIAGFPAYQWQTSIYHHATGLPVIVVIGVKKSDGSGDVEALHFHRLRDDEIIPLGKIKARVLQVEALARAGVPPETCDIPADGWCPFEYLHDGADDDALMDVQPDVDSDTAGQIAALANDYQRAKERETQFKAAKEEARDLLDELLGDQKKVSHDGFTVTKSTTYRKSFNTRALKADLDASVWSKYEETSDEPTVTIKVSVSK